MDKLKNIATLTPEERLKGVTVDDLRTESKTNEIMAVINEMIAKYKKNYLQPQLCSQTRLIYQDKLKQFKKIDLDGVVYQLGVIADSDQLKFKHKLCQQVVEHYEQRVKLIRSIENTIKYCSTRIFALIGRNLPDRAKYSTPGFCQTDLAIFEQKKCRPEDWVTDIAKPDKQLNPNWYQNLQQLQNLYLTTLQELLNILNILENSTSTNSDELQKIAEPAHETMVTLVERVEELYGIIRLDDVMTPDTASKVKGGIAGIKSAQAAKLAAYRIINNLDPEAPDANY